MAHSFNYLCSVYMYNVYTDASDMVMVAIWQSMIVILHIASWPPFEAQQNLTQCKLLAVMQPCAWVTFDIARNEQVRCLTDNRNIGTILLVGTCSMMEVLQEEELLHVRISFDVLG